MSNTVRVIATALLLTCASAALALGSRVEDCFSPTSGLELLDRQPELSEACEAIIQLDGRRYLQMGARLRQRSDELLVLRLNGSTHELALSPGAANPVSMAAEGLSQTLPIGAALSVYVPEDRVLEVFADAEGLADAEIPVVLESAGPAESRIGNFTCCPRRRPWYPIVDVLPTTAGPLPFMGLAGAGLLLVATVLRRYRLRER